MSRRLLLVTALVLAPSLAAAGPSKAWTAARDVHADAPVIAGIDVKSAKDSEAFKKFFPMLLKKKPEAKEVLDRLAKECSFDPFIAVNSIVAVVDDANDKGAFFIALDGWDAAKLGACGAKIATTEKKELKVGPVTKGIQKLEMVGKGDSIYLGWIGKDVVMIATNPTDRSFVEAMMGGKGAGEAGKLAKKIDTGATLWMSVIKSESIQKGIDMKALYGTIKIAKGNVAAGARIVTADKQQAADLVTAFNREMPNVQGSLPPAAQALAKSLKVKASGAEVQATASAPEADVLALLSLVMMMM